MMTALTAHAYNVVNLPESMTLADAMGIFSADEITAITVSDISDGRYTRLNDNQIREFYNTVESMEVYRTVNPTPFRGLAVNIYVGDNAVTYCLNSGIQLGLYGNENYICYKLSDDDTEKIMYLDDTYWDEEDKAGGEFVHCNTSRDFLKLPEEPWAQPYAKTAAAESLLPYEFTNIYSENISREQFCKLLGNMIAVKENYASIDEYMYDKGIVYLKNVFEDCSGVDNSVNILYALGIVSGRDDTRFDPYGSITREEAATMLCRLAEMYIWIGTETDLTYEDRWSISDWAKFYVTWTNEYGIMTGVSDTEFAPQGEYTVEQAISTIVRLYDIIQ